MDDFVFLDTETTGNDLLKDRLFQVCYKHKEQLTSLYFKPPLPISIKSQSITHVTDKMIEDKEAFADSSMKNELRELLTDHILVAHNAVFDITMLGHEGIIVPKFICTLKIARSLDTGSVIPEYNLQYLRYYLQLHVTASAHDAKDDVLVLEALFQRLYNKMLTLYKDRESAIAEMVRVSLEPMLFTILPFGKYKGKKIEDVAMSDRPYLEWLLEQKLQSTTSEEDWIYTLKHHLKVS